MDDGWKRFDFESGANATNGAAGAQKREGPARSEHVVASDTPPPVAARPGHSEPIAVKSSSSDELRGTPSPSDGNSPVAGRRLPRTPTGVKMRKSPTDVAPRPPVKKRTPANDGGRGRPPNPPLRSIANGTQSSLDIRSLMAPARRRHGSFDDSDTTTRSPSPGQGKAADERARHLQAMGTRSRGLKTEVGKMSASASSVPIARRGRQLPSVPRGRQESPKRMGTGDGWVGADMDIRNRSPRGRSGGAGAGGRGRPLPPIKKRSQTSVALDLSFSGPGGIGQARSRSPSIGMVRTPRKNVSPATMAPSPPKQRKFINRTPDPVKVTPVTAKRNWRSSTESRIATAEASKRTMLASEDPRIMPAHVRERIGPTLNGGAVFPQRVNNNSFFTPVPTKGSKSTQNAAAYNREIKQFLQGILDFGVRQSLATRVLRGSGGSSGPLLQSVMGDGSATSVSSLALKTGQEESQEEPAMHAVWRRWIEMEEELHSVEGSLVMSNPGDDTGPALVRGGLTANLVERLSNAKSPDPEYMSAFLLTYRSFLEPGAFLESMIRNFAVPEPELHKDQEYLAFYHEVKRKPIQFRTCNTLKLWVEKHWYDFEQHPELIDRLRQWVAQDLAKSDYGLLAENLEKAIQKKIQGGKRSVVHTRPDSVPASITPKPGSQFIDFSDVEVARQICLLEFEDYRQIHPTECMGQSWTKKNKAELAPSIGRMIKRSNTLPVWVATQILAETDCKIKNRVKVIVKFIKIAMELRKVNNFNAVMEITAGLQLSPIYRLKKTWELVPKKFTDILEELRQGFNSSNNWKQYRTAVKQCEPPILPYLGLYLTDLTFIEDGHPDELNGPTGVKLVNFLKCRQLAVVIRDIQQFQQLPYFFDEEPTIMCYLRNLEILSDDELFDLSLEQEPREEA